MFIISGFIFFISMISAILLMTYEKTKTIKIFGLGMENAAHAADVLVAVNNQSSITLDGLVRSLGFAGQQARQFGISGLVTQEEIE